jgi:penicillin amidase
VLEPTSGPELVEMLSTVTMPVSNLVWADRHGSIGYKLMGRVPKRKGDCPDLPKPGWTGDFEWDGWIPYDELPEVVDPEEGFIVTANNRVVDDDYPHHITSDWLDGYRAARIEQLLTETEEHDLESFRRMQTDLYSIPGDQVAHRLARLAPTSQREVRAIERLKSWDRTLSPKTVAGTIYQAFLLRLAREFTRAAIGDRDLADRYLDRADNGFIAHVTSPWRWHSHLLRLWEEGDEDLIGGSWDELVLEALRGALGDLEERFGPDPEQWQWGRVHALQFPHALGGIHPVAERVFNRTLHPGGGQETVAQIAYDPNDPYAAIWAPSWRMLADPAAPERSGWQAFTGQSGHAWSSHYDDLQPRWEIGATQSMAGEGPFETLVLSPTT